MYLFLVQLMKSEYLFTEKVFPHNIEKKKQIHKQAIRLKFICPLFSAPLDDIVIKDPYAK